MDDCPTPRHPLRPAFRLRFLPLLLVTGWLAGCEQVTQQLGLEDPGKKAARQDAEGKAVGGACRHSGRAIEDCYSLYRWLPKDAVFTGWKEMDAYMRENQIQTVEPQLPPAPPPVEVSKTKKKKTKAEGTDAGEAKPADEGKAPAEEKPAKH